MPRSLQNCNQPTARAIVRVSRVFRIHPRKLQGLREFTFNPMSSTTCDDILMPTLLLASLCFPLPTFSASAIVLPKQQPCPCSSSCPTHSDASYLKLSLNNCQRTLLRIIPNGPKRFHPLSTETSPAQLGKKNL